MKKFNAVAAFAAIALLASLLVGVSPASAQVVQQNVNVTGYTLTSDPCQDVTIPKLSTAINTATAASFTAVPPKGTLTPYVCAFKASIVGTNPTLLFGTAYGTLPTPVIASAQQATTGGTLAASTTYTYRVSGTNAAGETLASAEFSVTTGASTATNTITLSVQGFNGATGCNVYGRTAGSELKLTTGTLANGVCTYTDTNSASPSGALPTTNSTAGAAACVAVTGTFVVTTGIIISMGDSGTILFQGNPGGSICYTGGGTTPSIQGFMVQVQK